MTRPKIRFPDLFLFAFALAVSACPAAAADARIAVSAAQAQALGIETATLAAPGQAAGLTLPAQVAVPNAQVHAVAAPLPGLVQALGAAPGERVKRGQMLARIASPMLLEAQREYLNAANQAQLTAQAAKRDDQLLKEGIIAQGRQQASASAQAQAATALAERRQALRLAGLPDKAIADLAAGRPMSGVIDIASPIDGVVLEQSATVGGRAEQSALLYKVARLDPLWLEIQVPVKIAASVREGSRARVAVAAGGAGAPAGKVIAIGRQVNADTQTVSVRVLVSEGAAQLRPGQFVEAVLDIGAGAASAWRIPASGVLRQQEKAFVFVQRDGGFEALEVRVEGMAGEGALVTPAGPAALKDGDRVAVKGVSALKAAWMGIGKP